MSTEEYNALQEKLQVERDKNIELKFQNLEHKMDEIISLLRQNVQNNHTNSKRIDKLEELQRNCPVKTVQTSVANLKKETSFIRSLFRTPVIGIVVLTFWILFIFGILLAFGPESLVSFMSNFRPL